MKTWSIWAVSLLAIGCGGGSGTGSGQAGGNAVSVPFYATSVASAKFNNVLVTIYGVNLVDSSGGAVPAFTDSSGLTVDVRQLANKNGPLFEFLNASNVPAGAYSGAQILVSNSVTVTKAGSTTSTTYQFANANSGGSGMTDLAVSFKTPFKVNASSPVVFDFDLTQWSINSQGQVTASVGLEHAANVNPQGHQIDRPFQGVVESLSGSSGNQSFVLLHDGNQALQVQTNSSTTISNANGASNPALANGEHAFLTGMISNGAFVADSITIVNTTAVPPKLSHIVGSFSNVNATAGTFTLTVQSCDTAVSSTQLTVNTTSSTTFTADGLSEAQSSFFAQLAQYQKALVEVAGTVSGTTLTASSARIGIQIGGGGTPPLAGIGTATNVNATAGTFTLTVTGWMGFQLKKGQTYSVVTTSSTAYNLNGQGAAETALFAALTSTTPVVVVGTVSNGTITASALVIGSNGSGPGRFL